jgi:hypothetical protein
MRRTIKWWKKGDELNLNLLDCYLVYRLFCDGCRSSKTPSMSHWPITSSRTLVGGHHGLNSCSHTAAVGNVVATCAQGVPD